jgi:hypothetical protein
MLSSITHLLCHCLLLFLPLLVLSEPRVQVSCPGLSRDGTSRSEVSCADTPVRFQIMIAAEDVGCATAQEEPTSDAVSTTSTSAVAGATGTACANCPQGYSQHTPACTASPGSCHDDRDCCSHWCDYTTSTCIKKDTPHYLRRRLNPNTLPRQLKQTEDSVDPEARYDALYDDANSNYCAVNSDCKSFRCVEGYCDDGMSSDYVSGSGCDDTAINVLYTLGLSLDADIDVGVPNYVTNSAHTQWAMPGEFVDVSFPGTIVIKYVTESCTYNKNTYNTTCTLSNMQTFTINVATKGHQTDPSKISDDNKPAPGGNFSYIRSAVVFRTFEGGAAQFNRSGFVRAVVDAINYDRFVYQPGKAKIDSVEAFRNVPSKAVSIIVVDPQEKLVQYEVRVLNADAPAVRNRLLHAYFKFPLVLYLSHYGILSHINDQPFRDVNIDSSKSFSLLPEPIAYNDTETTTVFVTQSIKDLLGTGGVIAIVASCVVFVAASLYVIWRYFKQESTARLQSNIAKKQSKKEKDLNSREKELNMKVLALEQERDKVINSTKGIQSERDQMKKEAEEMEQTLKHLQSDGPERNLKELANQLDEENRAAMHSIEAQLQQENLAIRQQLEEAKTNNQKEPITLSSMLSQESIDEEALNNSIDNMVLSATMDNDEITKQLNKRKDQMMRRTKERNEKRKKKKLMEKEKQLQESKRAKVAITSLWAKVGLLDAKLQTNEQRVDELQKKAEESRKELELETIKKTKEAHNKLEERLRKRKQKQKNKNKKVAPARSQPPFPQGPPPPQSSEGNNDNGRSLYT